MFSQTYRLRHEKDIERVMKAKKGVFDVVCGIKFAPNNVGVSRFTIVVGSKVSKNAVERNRIRRQYREIVRRHLSEISPGFDVVLLTAKPALDLPYAEKQTRLLGVFGKANLLRAAGAVA